MPRKVRLPDRLQNGIPEKTYALTKTEKWSLTTNFSLMQCFINLVDAFIKVMHSIHILRPWESFHWSHWALVYDTVKIVTVWINFLPQWCQLLWFLHSKNRKGLHHCCVRYSPFLFWNKWHNMYLHQGIYGTWTAFSCMVFASALSIDSLLLWSWQWQKRGGEEIRNILMELFCLEREKWVFCSKND